MLENSPIHKVNEANLEDASFPVRYRFTQRPVPELDLRTLCSRYEPVMYWAPRSRDIARILTIAERLNEDHGRPLILEVGCGTGLLAYLLAASGKADVVATDADPHLTKNSIYRHPNLKYEECEASALDRLPLSKTPNLVLNSWMPFGRNFTPDMRKTGAQALIYVLEPHETGIPESAARRLAFESNIDADDLISYRPGNEYERILQWRGPAHWELTEHFRGFHYGEAVNNSNIIQLQLRKDLTARAAGVLSSLAVVEEPPPYPWEAELSRLPSAAGGVLELLTGAFTER